MPNIGELVSASAISYKLKGEDRKSILRSMAQIASDAYGIDANLVFENAFARETLGGTGVGEGVAIPHARLKGLDKSVGVFAFLETPVDFEAPDSQDADLVFLLLSPEDSGAAHLTSLARITRFMRKPGLRDMLRTARSGEALFAVLIGSSAEAIA